jgi:17beta-estradiol 17-dehydrogenase / very-long-chain 3-oxoacyl-CoA reductase
VTGGSDGLGRAYAIELAKMGFNIIIIGRRKEKLEETKTILE